VDCLSKEKKKKKKRIEKKSEGVRRR